MQNFRVFLRVVFLSGVGVFCGERAVADTLVLKDGRFLEDKSVQRLEGFYKVTFDHGVISIPEEMVEEHFRLDSSGEFVPSNPKEEEMARKGMVPWRGRWVTVSRRKRLEADALEKKRKSIEQQKARRKWRSHATVNSKRFVFHHTLPDEIFEEFQDLFETYFAFFVKYWGVRPKASFGRPVVNIYHDQEYFEQVSGAPSGVVGYYSPVDRELHFFYDRERSHFTVDVMFHEGNHLLCHMIDEKFRYPWWIGEGMAEYFGASQWDPEKREMTVGHLQSARLAVLNDRIEEGHWQSLSEMIRASRMGAVEYAWAWSFCHFLLSNPRYEKGFKKFFLALARSSAISKQDLGGWKRVRGDDQIEALCKFLRVAKIETLEREWYEYIKANLTTTNADLNYADAGWIMMIYGERKKARLLFKKAIDRGSTSAVVHYGYGRLQYDRSRTKTALKYAENALKYDPLHARAWALAGRCHGKLGKKEEGNRLLKLAQELDPDDVTIWFDSEFAEDEDDERGDGKKRGG